MVHGWLRSVYGVRNLSAKVVDTVIVWKLFSSQLVCKIHYYCSAVSQSQSITLFFSRIRDRMVRGLVSLGIFLDVWNTTKLRQDLLPFGGWNWSIIRESTFLPGRKKSSHFFIFWYGTESSSYGVPPPHNTHTAASTRNSPWRLILVGFTII